MEDAEIRKIMDQINSELNGDPDHDIEVLNNWGERYRNEPDAEQLMDQISHRLVELIMEEEGDLPQEIFENMLSTADEDYEQACLLIEHHKYEEALGKLLVLTELIRAYPLPDDAVWMDFNSYLDSLVYQDYYSEFNGDKEIRRHPMRPARILFTCGSLLIEMGRSEEALDPLKMLVSFDPVCPKYLFELGEAYKRMGELRDALENAVWALSCASTNDELARCYRDIGYCLSENGEYEDAMMFYMLSLHYKPSKQADMEIAWIQKKTGIKPNLFDIQKIMERCKELDIPVGVSETVQSNIDFLKLISGNVETENQQNDEEEKTE